jgi:hypothetical protein
MDREQHTVPICIDLGTIIRANEHSYNDMCLCYMSYGRQARFSVCPLWGDMNPSGNHLFFPVFINT